MPSPTIAQPIEGTGLVAYRQRDEPPQTLPIALRSACHLKIGKGRFRQPWSRRLVIVKWVISGEAQMRVEGRQIPFGRGQLAVYIPTVPHAFWVTSPVAEMCWFSIDGPLSEQFAYLLGMRPGVYPAGDPPVGQIEAMIESLSDQSLAGRQHSSMMVFQLMYDLMRELPAPQISSVLRQVRHLVQEGLADPNLSAGGIAAQLNYNRSSLSRMFHQHTGMTIMDCITQTRLDEAKLLLSRTQERVGDIARKCGFRDIAYFSRWVRRNSGRSPSQLRKTDAEPAAKPVVARERAVAVGA